MSTGIVARAPRLEIAQLRALIMMIVRFPCWTVSGTMLWDVEHSPTLRPIRRIDVSEDFTIRGDFGHAFSPRAEIRWKRLDEHSYDVLILSDQQPNISGILLLEGPWRTQTVTLIQNSVGRPAIRGLVYYAPNGASQFVRYVEEVEL